MDKERLKGSINEIAGRAKRQVGEWTGDKTAQVEGLAQEMKGKAQLAWCGVKDALRAMQRETAPAGGKAEGDAEAEFRAAFRSRPRGEQH
jgi:uncharacterized protein YjbJ (UPF0337 family)